MLSEEFMSVMNEIVMQMQIFSYSNCTNSEKNKDGCIKGKGGRINSASPSLITIFHFITGKTHLYLHTVRCQNF